LVERVFTAEGAERSFQKSLDLIVNEPKLPKDAKKIRAHIQAVVALAFSIKVAARPAQ
jgi:hypothetical protein